MAVEPVLAISAQSSRHSLLESAARLLPVRIRPHSCSWMMFPQPPGHPAWHLGLSVDWHGMGEGGRWSRTHSFS